MFFGSIDQFDLYVNTIDTYLGSTLGALVAFLFLVDSLASLVFSPNVSGNKNTYTMSSRSMGFGLSSFVFFLEKYISGILVQNKKTLYIFIFCFLFFVLFFNISGLIPTTLTLTAFSAVTVVLGSFSVLIALILGVRGLGWYFFEFFLPPGVPFFSSFLMVMLEMISYFTRILSLGVRLFANLMAGHVLIKVVVSFWWSLFDLQMYSNFIYLIFVFFITFVSLGIFFLETCVAFLQTYIYITLTLIYWNDSVSLQ